MVDSPEKILSLEQDRKTSVMGLERSELSELKSFGQKVNRFGFNFAVCNINGEIILASDGGKFESSTEQLSQFGLTALQQQAEQKGSATEVQVQSLGKENVVLAAVVMLSGQNNCVVLIDLGREPTNQNDRLRQFCFEQNVDYTSLAQTLKDSVRTDSDYLSEILSGFVDNFQSRRQDEQNIEMVSTELAQTYEELVLIHKLSTNMKVTETDDNYLQMACDSLTDIVNVEGIAILLEKTIEDEKKLVLTAGSGLIDIDERIGLILQNRLAEQIENGKEALLDSEVDSPFKYDWPDNIQNIIAVPLFGKDRTTARNENSMIGLMVAVNRMDKQDFDSTDVKLFNSVANGCAVFVENGRLFRDLKELFIGSLKALTNSIDAKDEYTRGHSERVAFISRWIAERLAEHEPFEEEQIHKVYLAGLLHDIGKVGINEAVLRKKGKLTEKEINHIREHPSIGANILCEIKQMRDIVPGVLYHHERVDGRGYPNGLVGQQIPIIGKIIGLADGFDAMTSKRVYRDALTLEQALQEIRDGLGTQFDEKIGTIFLNSDVYHLWDVIQEGSDFSGRFGKKSKFSQYGTIAVGTLIR